MAVHNKACRPDEIMNDEERVLQKFFNLPEDKQQKLCDLYGKLLTDLKEDWESKPENKGKTITYSELWENFAKEIKSSEQVVPPYGTQGAAGDP